MRHGKGLIYIDYYYYNYKICIFTECGCYMHHAYHMALFMAASVSRSLKIMEKRAGSTIS